MSLSFFESLAIADQERIHSQMLAWMLSSSPHGAPLTAAQRRRLLRHAFGFRATAAACATLRVYTELNQIDIVVLAADGILVIENKLKSRQSQQQLTTYSKTIEALISQLGVHAPRVVQKCFLTISGEHAEQEGWRDVDYRKLYKALVKIEPVSQYVRDYTLMLGRLLDHRDKFLRDHTLHPLVFLRSGMSNKRRLAYPSSSAETEVERFTFDNRLERMFCEALLLKVGAALAPRLHFVGETRGRALIETRLFTFNAAAGARFNCGLQLQGDTLKLNIGAANYAGSSKEQIQPLEVSLDDAMSKALSQEAVTVKLKTNPGKKRAYRSWSHTIDKADVLPSTSLVSFVADYDRRLIFAERIWQVVLSELEREGLVCEIKKQESSRRVTEVVDASLTQTFTEI